MFLFKTNWECIVGKGSKVILRQTLFLLSLFKNFSSRWVSQIYKYLKSSDNFFLFKNSNQLDLSWILFFGARNIAFPVSPLQLDLHPTALHKFTIFKKITDNSPFSQYQNLHAPSIQMNISHSWLLMCEMLVC